MLSLWSALVCSPLSWHVGSENSSPKSQAGLLFLHPTPLQVQSGAPV